MSFGTMSKSNVADQIAEALGNTLVCATGRNLSPQATGHLRRAAEKIAALSHGLSAAGQAPTPTPTPTVEPLIAMHGDDQCSATRGWRCSLQSGHDGPHKHCGDNGVAHAIWAADSEPPPAPPAPALVEGWNKVGSRHVLVRSGVAVASAEHGRVGLWAHWLFPDGRQGGVTTTLDEAKAAAEAAFPAAFAAAIAECEEALAHWDQGNGKPVSDALRAAIAALRGAS